MEIRAFFWVLVLISLKDGIVSVDSARENEPDTVKFVVECEKPNEENGHSKLLSVQIQGNENKKDIVGDSMAGESSINPEARRPGEAGKKEERVSSPIVTDPSSMNKQPSTLSAGKLPARIPTIDNSALLEKIQKFKDSLPNPGNLFERKAAASVGTEPVANPEVRTNVDDSKVEETNPAPIIATPSKLDVANLPARIPALDRTALSEKIQKLKESIPSTGNLFERKAAPSVGTEPQANSEVRPKDDDSKIEETVSSSVVTDPSQLNRQPLNTGNILSNLPVRNPILSKTTLSEKIQKIKDSLPSSSNLLERTAATSAKTESPTNPQIKPKDNDNKQDTVSSSVVPSKVNEQTSRLSERIQNFKDSLPSSSKLLERTAGKTDSSVNPGTRPNDVDNTRGETISPPSTTDLSQRSRQPPILGTSNILSNLPATDAALSERIQRLTDSIANANNLFNTANNISDNAALQSAIGRTSILDPAQIRPLLNSQLGNIAPLISSAMPVEMPGIIASRTPAISRTIGNTIADIRTAMDNSALSNRSLLPTGRNLPLPSAADTIARLRDAASVLSPQRSAVTTAPPPVSRLESIRQRLRPATGTIVDPSFDNFVASTVNRRPSIQRPLGRGIATPSAPERQSILSRLRNNSPNVQSVQPLSPLQKALESIKSPALQSLPPSNPSRIRNFDLPPRNTISRTPLQPIVSPLSRIPETQRRPLINALRDSDPSASSNAFPSILNPTSTNRQNNNRLNLFGSRGANFNNLESDRVPLSRRLPLPNISDIVNKGIPNLPAASLPSDKIPASILGVLSPNEAVRSRAPEIKKTLFSIARKVGDTYSVLKNTTDGLRRVIMPSNSSESSVDQSKNDTQTQNDNDSTVSSSNRIETCDICDCLMKFVPKDVQGGKFVMRDGNPSQPMPLQRPSQLRLPDKLSKLRNQPKEDTVGSATNQYASYALPPSSFNNGNETPNEPSNSDRTSEIENGIKRVIDFVDIVDELDQYVAGRTKNLVSKLYKIYGKDNIKN